MISLKLSTYTKNLKQIWYTRFQTKYSIGFYKLMLRYRIHIAEHCILHLVDFKL